MGYLTGPVNNLADFQVEFNGFLMGAGTAFEIPASADFLDMAAIKTMDQQRVWADGSWSGPDFADVVLPSMPVEISGVSPADFYANVAAFRNVFTPQTTPAPLWVKLPGLPAQGIAAKTNKRSMPIGIEWNGGFTSAAVQWRCPDPAWQSVPRSLTLAASGATVSGLVFPMFNVASGTYAVPGVADFGSLTSSTSSGSLTNAGNTPAWPVATVSGAIAGGFTVTIDGNSVSYSGSLQSSDTVVIDYAAGTATLNGTADRTYLLTMRSFSAVPAQGTSSVFFTAASGSCQIVSADMWR